jgi:tetratricopeptide (TPR) repeat protein
MFYYHQRRYAEAEPLMRRALLLDEARLGAKNPTVAIRLNNLAALLYATERLPEAEPLMKRALAIFEQALEPEHPSTITARQNYQALLAEIRNRGTREAASHISPVSTKPP